MTSQHPAPRAVQPLHSRRGSLRRLATTALLLAAACAPPAAIGGADRVADALRAPVPAETTRAALVRSAAGGEVVAAGSVRRAARTADAPAALRGSRDAAWVGHYALGRGRRAALALTLEGDAPTGELALWGTPGASTFDAGGGRVVRVRLARARFADGTLAFDTEPFFDPTCGCTVEGRFTGALRGDTLSGRVTLAGAPTLAERRGRWTAVRRPDGR